MTAEPLLSLDGLRKAYGALKVTDGVDLALRHCAHLPFHRIDVHRAANAVRSLPP